MKPSNFDPTDSSLQSDLHKARLLANLLDARFNVLGFKFGLDALIGLIPIAGDTAALLAGLYPLLLVRKHGLGNHLAVRMGINLLIDYGGGLIPIVGDLFDAGFRANLKNLDILEKAVRDRSPG